MTRRELDTLRLLIDQRRRALINDNAAGHRCNGCGCERADRTAGCKACSSRHGKKRRRAAARAAA